MTGSMRQKLEELKELRVQNYITEQEYAAARSNIFLDAGFDILPRTELDARYAYAPPQREGLERKGCGCGCFLTLLLLIVALLGGLFALPEDLRAALPGLDRVFGIEQVQEARRAVLRFIDDLMGRPEGQAPYPLSSSDSRPSEPAEPTTAVPVPLPGETGSGAQSGSGQGGLLPLPPLPSEALEEGDSPASPDSEEGLVREE